MQMEQRRLADEVSLTARLFPTRCTPARSRATSSAWRAVSPEMRPPVMTILESVAVRPMSAPSMIVSSMVTVELLMVTVVAVT